MESESKYSLFFGIVVSLEWYSVEGKNLEIVKYILLHYSKTSTFIYLASSFT